LLSEHVVVIVSIAYLVTVSDLLVAAWFIALWT